MAVFKCKMCSGTLDITAGATVVQCDYCGTTQTVPNADDEKKIALFTRANRLRAGNEFDKASGIYESIIADFPEEAEAYWGLVLCKYGVEYVDDPATGNKIPTCHRSSFESVMDDNNFELTLEYADAFAKRVYREEAKQLEEIRKGIIEVSSKEEPYDIFICYKETDANGRRTPDSVLAQDLYYQLTQEGFKVFFSRITLEDKLGSAYEPYIFAALNSAKVMVVLGTKPEYFNAVWVKNEWSRYLALIKNGAKKMLIPAYKDMDPYDLPEEFSHLQAQDMSKLGFMQDLIRGIKKIAQVDTPKVTVVKENGTTSSNANATALLKRVFIFLEDGDWSSANEYCEKVLDIDPENALAYVGKLMVDLRVKTQEQLKDCNVPFDNNKNFQKAVRFADDSLCDTLNGYIEHIKTRNQNARYEHTYLQAIEKMSACKKFLRDEAIKLFESISDYKDSASLAEKCKKADEAEIKDEIYAQAKNQMCDDNIPQYEGAIKKFESLSGWKDSDDQIEICKNRIEEIKAKIEADRLERERKAELEAIRVKKLKAHNRKWLLRYLVIIGVAFLAAGIIDIIGATMSNDFNVAYVIGNVIGIGISVVLMSGTSMALFGAYFLVAPRSKRRSVPIVLKIVTLITAGSGVLVWGLGVLGGIGNFLSGLSNFAQDAAAFGMALGTVIINAGTFIIALFIKRK